VGLSKTTFFGCFGGYFFGNFSQKASNVRRQKGQQESRIMAGKPHDIVVKFDTYQSLQRLRAVLPAIARLSRC